MRTRHIIWAVCLVGALVLAATGLRAAGQILPEGYPDGLKAVDGWVVSSQGRVFTKGSLYGYIDGGAEAIIHYGFRRLSVFYLVPRGAAADSAKEITLEIYEMETPEGAVGVFNSRGAGDEYVSPRLRTVHWIGSKQANFVKGVYYVNIMASGCTQQEVEEFTLALFRDMPLGRSELPLDESWLPELDFVPGTGHYMTAEEALAYEPFLSSPFWGIGQGETEAYSVKYGPGPADYVLLYFNVEKPDLDNEVLKLFRDYLAQVNWAEDFLQGVDMQGKYYLFGKYGKTGVLILGAPDATAARKALAESLDRARQSLEKRAGEKKKPPVTK